MNPIDVTIVPDAYRRATAKNLRGTVSEVSYEVKHYINYSRQLVTDNDITSAEAGRETVHGDGLTKVCTVYLPAGYNERDSAAKYDVLYLLHGVGGNRQEWLDDNGIVDGNFIICNILDNLIANGDVEPLIVVFPDGRSAEDWTNRSFTPPGINILGFYYFDYELRYDLIPFIESTYHTYANIRDRGSEAIAYSRLHRAVAGLSMGGMQSLNLTLGGYRYDSTVFTGTESGPGNGLDKTVRTPGMLDLFAYVGAFSNAPTSSSGKVLGEHMASCEHQLNLLYLTCGDADSVAFDAGYHYVVNGLAEAAGDSVKCHHQVIVKDGMHDFAVWNNGIYNFVRLSFGKGVAGAERTFVQMTLEQ